MPIAAFLGGHPRHTPTERAHRVQTVGIPENERRRLALLRGIGPIPDVCTIFLTAEGDITESSLGCLQARRPGRQPPAIAGRRDAPAGAPPRPLVIPEPPLPPPPRASDYWIYQTDQFAGLGANADRFSPVFFRPFILERLTIHFAQGDPGNSHVQVLLRNGDDTTAGIQPNDREIWVYPDPVVGGVLATTGAAAGDTIDLALNLVVTTFPVAFHTRAINIGGGSGLHLNVLAYCRWLTRQEVLHLNPTPLTPARALADFGHFPRPRSTTGLRYPGSTAREPNNNMARIEQLAQLLRESPFGVNHQEMLGRAGALGFSNPAAAVALAITQAARPPNIAALAAAL